MTPTEMDQLRRWAKLAGLPPDEVSSPYDLAHFFQRFRPDGAGVEAVFEGVVCGEQILELLMLCYECTAGQQPDSHVYFVPRGSDCDRETAMELMTQHLASMRDIAGRQGEDELVELLRRTTPTFAAAGEEADAVECDDDSPEGWIWDTVTDYMLELEPIPSSALMLHEALYSIANHIFLRYFILWPLYEKGANLKDPFRAHFSLWSRGVRTRFPDDDTCLIFMPRPVKP